MKFLYVGDPNILAQADLESPRCQVQTKQDFLQLAANKDITWATYIVDTKHRLWLADRHSEHVACARGQAVLAAGEMAWIVNRAKVEIVEVTNQSTGYCPTPESWRIVSTVLEQIGIVFPQTWTQAFLFRRCVCGQINIVKNAVFECAVCGKELSPDWNFEL
jgi:hypothetical protein